MARTLWFYRCADCRAVTCFPVELQENTPLRCGEPGCGGALVFDRTEPR